MSPKDHFPPCEVGDVLVQARGFPWPQLAYIFTGEPFPHAQIVSVVDDQGRILKIIESHATGLMEKDPWSETKDWFEVWRPKCSNDVKQEAILWLLGREGLVYPIHKLLAIAAGTRLGLWQEGEEFDSEYCDSEPMVCSEAITRALWRSGYDPAPGVSNRNTLPADLRNPRTMEPVRTIRRITIPI
jgi:hypothetical protein